MIGPFKASTRSSSSMCAEFNTMMYCRSEPLTVQHSCSHKGRRETSHGGLTAAIRLRSSESESGSIFKFAPAPPSARAHGCHCNCAMGKELAYRDSDQQCNFKACSRPSRGDKALYTPGHTTRVAEALVMRRIRLLSDSYLGRGCPSKSQLQYFLTSS